ncbi:hypothetical protein ACJX0J_030571 [Zea mays]
MSNACHYTSIYSGDPIHNFLLGMLRMKIWLENEVVVFKSFFWAGLVVYIWVDMEKKEEFKYIDLVEGFLANRLWLSNTKTKKKGFLNVFPYAGCRLKWHHYQETGLGKGRSSTSNISWKNSLIPRISYWATMLARLENFDTMKGKYFRDISIVDLHGEGTISQQFWFLFLRREDTLFKEIDDWRRSLMNNQNKNVEAFDEIRKKAYIFVPEGANEAIDKATMYKNILQIFHEIVAS